MTAGKRLLRKTVSTKEDITKLDWQTRRTFSVFSFLICTKRQTSREQQHQDHFFHGEVGRGGVYNGESADRKCSVFTSFSYSVEAGRGGAGLHHSLIQNVQKTRRPLVARARILSPTAKATPSPTTIAPLPTLPPKKEKKKQTKNKTEQKTNQEVLCAFLLAGAVEVTPRHVASSLSLRLEVLRRRERDPVLPP